MFLKKYFYSSLLMVCFSADKKEIKNNTNSVFFFGYKIEFYFNII